MRSDSDAADHDPLIGSILLERFRVLSRFREDSTGILYKVVQSDTGRPCLMKIYGDPLSPMDCQIFLERMRRIGMIEHPNVAKFIDFGQFEMNRVCSVFEMFEGPTLEEVLQAGPLPAARALHIGRQIAAGLGAVHQDNLISRDLRPENIFLIKSWERTDIVKIADFGIERAPRNGILTGASTPIIGPEYLSPEQAFDKDLDPRANQYSLGCILYQMLTGVVPFSSDDPVETMIKHQREPVIAPQARSPQREIPPAMNAAIVRALEKDPRQRFSSMEEFERALRGSTYLPQVASAPHPVELTSTMSGGRIPDPPSPPPVTSPIGAYAMPAVSLHSSLPDSFVTKLGRFLGRYSDQDRVEQAFAQLDWALFGVDAPRRMITEHPAKISAVAIRDHLQQALVQSALAQDGARIEAVQLGQRVHVELLADNPSSFTIQPLSEAEQPVLQNQLTHWEWSVIAHAPGAPQILRLRAANCVDAAGKTLRKSHPVRTIEVNVEVFSFSTPAPQLEIETALLRKILDEVLHRDSDIEAFLLDYFPEIFRRLGRGMERMEKLTLLLAHAKGTDILRRLKEADLETVQQFLRPDVSPAPTNRSLYATNPGPTPAALASAPPPPQFAPIIIPPAPKAPPSNRRLMVAACGAVISTLLLCFMPAGYEAVGITSLVMTLLATILTPSR